MQSSAEFTLEIRLAASATSVYDVLSNPAQKSRWLFGSAGVSGKLLISDIRARGVEICRMQFADGAPMMTRSEYLAVARAEGMSYQSEVKIKGRLVSRSEVNLTVTPRPGGSILRHREICSLIRPPETIERRKDLLRWLLPQIDAVAAPVASNVIWLKARPA